MLFFLNGVQARDALTKKHTDIQSELNENIAKLAQERKQLEEEKQKLELQKQQLAQERTSFETYKKIPNNDQTSIEHKSANQLSFTDSENTERQTRTFYSVNFFINIQQKMPFYQEHPPENTRHTSTRIPLVRLVGIHHVRNCSIKPNL